MKSSLIFNIENLLKLPIHISEMIIAAIGIFTALGIATFILKKYGLITFGKPLERRSCGKDVARVCDQHQKFSEDVKAIAGDVEAINGRQIEIKKQLSSIDLKIDNLIIHHARQDGVDLR